MTDSQRRYRVTQWATGGVGSEMLTAMQVVNAVPAVCDAPPRFATSADLPLIRSRAGFSKFRARS